MKPNNDPITKVEKVIAGIALLWLLFFALVLSLITAGCMRVISIDKHDPVILTDPTNGVHVVDGGYTVKYRNIGLKTDVSSIKARKTDNAVLVEISGVQTDVSTENKEIVGAGGTAIGNVAEKVIQGVK